MNDQPKRLRQISIFESLQHIKRQKTSSSVNMNDSDKLRLKTLAAAEERLSSSIVKPEIPLVDHPNFKEVCESIPSTSHSEKYTTKKPEFDESASFSEKQTTSGKVELNLLASCSTKETTADSDSEGSFQNSADLFPHQTSSQDDYSSGYSAELFPNCTGSQTSSQSDDTDEEDEDEMMLLNRSPLCWFPLPKLEPLENHSIMFSPHIRPGDPPRPYPSSYRDEWSTTHVRMPCSPRNKYPIVNGGGVTIIESRWKLICQSLRGNIRSSEELEEAIMKYNSQYIGRWNFRALHVFLNVCLNKTEREHFFDEILPAMIEMALDMPNICTQPVPLLTKGKDHKVTMTQKQIGCLLLNAFFCTFPRRTLLRNRRPKWQSEYANFPDINFNRLFYSPKREISERNIGKLKCLLNYFRRITTEVPTGTVTFHRQSLEDADLPKWHESARGFKPAVIRSSGLIETLGQGMLQVDFANKYVGGGVLGSGCVQEEIRFVICPELIVSRLLVECLGFNEVLIITGVEQYNKYSGYADSFKWEGDFRDVTSRDSWGRRHTQVVAMDATHFKDMEVQFKPTCIKRELNKAYCGFYENCPPTTLSAVATGNWGCGAFKGNCNLKFLIQLMAASEAGRSLLYVTFGNKKLKSELQDMYNFLNERNLVVGDVWRLLVRYSENLNYLNQKEKFNLYGFIYSQFVTKGNYRQENLGNGEQLNDSDKQAAEKLVQIVNDEDSSSTDIEQSQD